MAGHEATAREYYRSLDEGDYETLAELLAPSFVHERPDRTIEGRERFVGFMRDERPLTETTHPVDAVYVRAATDGGGAPAGEDGPAEVAVRGRLLKASGERIVSFVDVFEFTPDGSIRRLQTFSR